MFRLPRLWSKKRGSRLAGWQVWGAVGESLFFAALFLVGVFTLALTIARQLSSPNPTEIRLGLGFWTLVLSSVSLVITGGASLAYRIIRVGSSSERRAATGLRDSDPRPRLHQQPELPCVPDQSQITDSPGIRLAYRLPVSGSPLWLMASAAALTLGWNAVCVALVAVEIEAIRAGRASYLKIAVLLLLVWIGWKLLNYFVGVLRKHLIVGAVIVELSDHPLRPGKDYELYITQFGRLNLRRLDIDLVCEEEATFLQGTDVRVERQVVRRENLWSEAKVRIDPTAGWEQQFPIRVPNDAMHSFHSPHNAVKWKIEVRGESRRWPSFCRSFPVVVHPYGSDLRGR